MKIATKLTKRVSEFVNDRGIGVDRFYDKCINSFFHYPVLPYDSGHLRTKVSDGYYPVAEQEFIDMATDELAGKTDTLKPKEMKTKCIVLGQENDPVKELKKIELKKCMQVKTGVFSDLGGLGPNIDLNEKFSELALNPTYKIEGYDLIHATTRTGSYQIWLGHWNDGVA